MRVFGLVAAVAVGWGSLDARAGDATSGTDERAAASILIAQAAPAGVLPAAGAVSAPAQAKPLAPATSEAAQAQSTEPAIAAPRDTPEAPAAQAPSPPPAPLPPTLVAKINLTSQRMEVSVDGKSRHTWAISSGRSGYLTPRGKFRVQWTARIWHSRKYDLAPMPHSVFFNGGIAVHGTSSVGLLGQPASHGCVRLAPGNAAQFYGLVQKHGHARTQITVVGTTPEQRIARRTRGQDPWGNQQWARSSSGRLRYGGEGYYASGTGYAGPRTFVSGGVRYMRVP